MKAIVEWGKPKAACENRPCGVSGQFIVQNPTQAKKLASQLFFTLSGGEQVLVDHFLVEPLETRKVLWSKNRDAWVCVSLLDGFPRGAYAAYADKEAENPGYAVCPKCGAIAGSRHKLACPNGPGQVEASLEHAHQRWYFQQVCTGIPEFYVVPKKFYDENEFRDPNAYEDPKLEALLPAGFEVMLDWVEFKGDPKVGRQALLDAGFIEHGIS